VRHVGVIGGSGLYELPDITEVEVKRVTTPFGATSDDLVTGRLGDVRVTFLPRHGRGHRILPTEVNFRANVFAMKELGVEWLLSVGAVGSLRQEIAPGHVVVPNQFIDRTVARPSTFFGRGIVVHVSLADPVCPLLAAKLRDAAKGAGGVVHSSGTYICMEGPQFSTRAESEMYRSWGADIIGMTNWQEAKLAREAEICFASLALCTDYDCWNAESDHVVIEDVLRILGENVDLARRTIAGLVLNLPSRDCGCSTALANAIITNPDMIPEDVKRDLHPLVGKYLGGAS
jgi:5'-methylthioadenosine phosphorylase